MNGRAQSADDPVLTGSPLFAELSELEYGACSALLKKRHIAKDETVFHQGEPGNEIFILRSGELNAFAERAGGVRQWMFKISPPSFFGEMSVIAHIPRSATIAASDDSELVVLGEDDFYYIINHYPMIAVKVLKAIGNVQSRRLEQDFRYLGDLIRWGNTALRRTVTDELTGLYNRRFLEDTIRDRFAQGMVGLRKMGLLMMDLDRVHEINEHHGTEAGDQVIIAAARIIESRIRSADIAARLSGDEFAILLPDTDEAGALCIAERIRRAVHTWQIRIPHSPRSEETLTVSVGISIGVAVAPVHGADLEPLVDAADNALRRAKGRGRNRVEAAPGLPLRR
ncbi:MAG: GGDEF domain-containing protein [Spirochaetaceae bacterium]|jgi:diguanylate cyclase (GGDEF)-like protein|nr:GGDEF domain-containing protein [Spirochaetaceae bacterium]